MLGLRNRALQTGRHDNREMLTLPLVDRNHDIQLCDQLFSGHMRLQAEVGVRGRVVRL